jgi:hypothetical protein
VKEYETENVRDRKIEIERKRKINGKNNRVTTS